MVRAEQKRDEFALIIAPTQEEAGETIQPGVEHGIVLTTGKDTAHSVQTIGGQHVDLPRRTGTVWLLDARPLGSDRVHEMPTDGQDAAAVVEPFGHLVDLPERNGVEAPCAAEFQFAEFAAGDGRIVSGVGLGIGVALDLPPGVAGQQVVLMAVHDALVADLPEPLKEFLRFRSGLGIRAFEGLRRHGQRSPQSENCQQESFHDSMEV